MSQDHEDFGPLRRLLVLKRYERPHPGYFTHFSIQVIARLKAGEGAQQSFYEHLWWDPGWLHRLWVAIETKPGLAWAFGATVWALSIAAVIYAVRPEGPPPGQGLLITKGARGNLATFRFSVDEPTVGTYAGFSDPIVISDWPVPWSSSQGLGKPTSPFVPVRLFEPK